MIALLTRKTLQMVHIRPCPHHHLERRYHLIACRTQSGVPEQPQIVALAQHQIRLRVQRAAHLAQPTVAAAALQAVLVPEHVQGAQQKPIGDRFAAARALMLLGARCRGRRIRGGQNWLRFGACVHRHCGVRTAGVGGGAAAAGRRVSTTNGDACAGAFPGDFRAGVVREPTKHVNKQRLLGEFMWINTGGWKKNLVVASSFRRLRHKTIE